MEQHQQFMRMAIELASQSIRSGGGPFGAVVVCNGQAVGMGANSVTVLNDPTAHAEVMAIRDASKKLNRFDLSDCILYTSCEPCPMCLGAVYWSRIKTVYCGSNRQDAAKAGFDDALIYTEISLPAGQRSVVMQSLLEKEASKPFDEWIKTVDKTAY